MAFIIRVLLSLVFLVSACSAQTYEITVSAQRVAFGKVPVGHTSPPKTIKVKNVGTGTVTLSVSTSPSQYSYLTDCGTLAPTTKCSIELFFTPSSLGKCLGNLQIAVSSGSKVLGVIQLNAN